MREGAVPHKRSPTTQREVNDRRELVAKHMCDLMHSMVDNEKYSSPDQWLDSIVELEPFGEKRATK